MEQEQPQRVDATVKLNKAPPSWVSYAALGGVIFQVLTGGNGWITNLRDDAGKRAEAATKVEGRIADLERDLTNQTASLRSDLSGVKVGLDQRFTEERAAREQVDKNSEFRRTTVTEKLNDLVDLLSKRMDAMTAQIAELRRNMSELNTQSSILKGMLSRKGELQSLPSPITPDGARGGSSRSRTERAAAEAGP